MAFMQFFELSATEWEVRYFFCDHLPRTSRRQVNTWRHILRHCDVALSVTRGNIVCWRKRRIILLFYFIFPELEIHVFYQCIDSKFKLDLPVPATDFKELVVAEQVARCSVPAPSWCKVWFSSDELHLKGWKKSLILYRQILHLLK